MDTDKAYAIINNPMYHNWFSMSPTQREVAKAEMGAEEFKKFDDKMMKDYEDAANYLKVLRNIYIRPTPTAKPFNKEEADNAMLHPTGYPEIDAKMREIFRDSFDKGLGHDEFVKVWHSDIRGQYFKTAKEIKDFMAKVQEKPFKLPTSFEALKNGVVDSLDRLKGRMTFKTPSLVNYYLRQVNDDLKYSLNNTEKWTREGDKKWSEYRKDLVDSNKFTPAQKSRILTAFDKFIKEELNNPYNLKHTKTYNSKWIGRLVSAEREPTPTPTPTAKPTPTATP
jgi:Txe/YoeB family toxin of Txe-Axe toxin-antitoxin module